MDFRKRQMRRHVWSRVSKTPILDQREEIPISPHLPEESELLRLIRACTNVSALLSIFLLNCRAGGPGFLVTVAAVIAAAYLCTLVHEIGHLFVGVMLGRTCSAFVVGQMSVTRDKTGWQIRFSNQLIKVSGHTAMLPSRPGVSRAKDMMISAAGPAANAATFIACMVLGKASAVGSPFWLWPVAIVSVAMLLQSLIPGRTAETETDGAKLIALIRGDGIANSINADLLGRLARGEKACSWNPALLEQARQVAVRPLQRVVANWLSYIHSMAVGDPAAAANHLEMALANCRDAGWKMRQMLFHEAAFVQAHYRNQMELARSWFDRAEHLRLCHQPGSKTSSDAMLITLTDCLSRVGPPSPR